MVERTGAGPLFARKSAMNKILTSTIAALTALSSVATAIPAQAQSGWYDNNHDGRQDSRNDDRHDDRDGRNDRYDNRYDNRYEDRDDDRDGRHGQYDRHDRKGKWSRHDNGQRGRHHWRDQRGRNWSYYGSNYGYNGYDGQWRTGQRFSQYQNRSYMVNDYGNYGLPAPRQGYRYYRDNNGDIVMATIAGGIIGLIIGTAIGR